MRVFVESQDLEQTAKIHLPPISIQINPDYALETCKDCCLDTLFELLANRFPDGG
jgi:hypothetical protein